MYEYQYEFADNDYIMWEKYIHHSTGITPEDNHLIGRTYIVRHKNNMDYEWVVEYFKENMKYYEEWNFDWLHECSLYKNPDKTLWIFHNRYPRFISDRLPNKNRPDLQRVLEKYSLRNYDVTAILDANKGMCITDLIFLDDRVNPVDIVHPRAILAEKYVANHD
jgi:hypothetical protein